MGDIGNLVYVLLIVLFVVMQIFAASKKKKQNQQSGESSEKNPWDDVFGEMTGQQTKDTAEEGQPNYEETAAPEEDAPFDPEEDYRERRQPNRYEREKAKPAAEKPQPAKPVNKYMKYMRDKDKPAGKKRNIESVAPEVEYLESQDDQLDFDLRKAVIYSAILERKW